MSFLAQRSEEPLESKDCQTWMKEYVEALVAAGILPQEASAIVATAPQH
jgi:hypothetical protein